MGITKSEFRKLGGTHKEKIIKIIYLGYLNGSNVLIWNKKADTWPPMLIPILYKEIMNLNNIHYISFYELQNSNILLQNSFGYTLTNFAFKEIDDFIQEQKLSLEKAVKKLIEENV